MKPTAWALMSGDRADSVHVTRDFLRGDLRGKAVPLYTLAQVAEMLEAEGLAWEKVAPHAGSYSMGWAADWLRAKEAGTP